MNVYDSASYGGHAGARRLCRDRDAEDADLIILNTCHIREKAAEKVYSELGRLRELKEAAAREGRQHDDRRRRLRGAGRRARKSSAARRAVDLVVGPQSYHRLPELIARVQARREWSRPNFRSRTNSTSRRAVRATTIAQRGVTAFVTVQEGCDKFCTFCVVPYTRGAEVSRPVAKIVAEVERLADAGVREVTLIGQNVNAYHGEGPDGRPGRSAHCCAVSPKCRGIARLRYTTSHPRDMDDDLIAAHRDLRS